MPHSAQCPSHPPCFPRLQQHAHPPFFLYLFSFSAITHLFPGPAPAVLTLGKSPSVSALAALWAGLVLVAMHAFPPFSRLLFPLLCSWSP